MAETLTVGQRKQRDAITTFDRKLAAMDFDSGTHRTLIAHAEVLVLATIDATHEDVRAALVKAGVL
jgi:hypothetical protein